MPLFSTGLLLLKNLNCVDIWNVLWLMAKILSIFMTKTLMDKPAYNEAVQFPLPYLLNGPIDKNSNGYQLIEPSQWHHQTWLVRLLYRFRR